jgi:2-polyprenyl-3-methyl-5-hydroxy-6-metoxy-1,4-benzoquinol methylase
MTQTIKLHYGSTQPLLSQRMRTNPTLAKLVNKVVGYTNIGNYARSKVFAKQISTLNLAEMQNILDLGCGYGEYSFMMAKTLPNTNIKALDIDKDALEKVRYAQENLKLKNLEIFEGFIDQLPESNFDLIYSVDVFEHIQKDQMPFTQAHNKLRKGGYLMVKMPNITQTAVFPKSWFKAHEEWLNHEHPGQVYTLNDLKERFKSEGFNIIFASQTDGILSRFAWELAYLMKKAGTLFQLLSLPICKLLISADMFFTRGNTQNGNAITVIGQKK